MKWVAAFVLAWLGLFAPVQVDANDTLTLICPNFTSLTNGHIIVPSSQIFANQPSSGQTIVRLCSTNGAAGCTGSPLVTCWGSGSVAPVGFQVATGGVSRGCSDGDFALNCFVGVDVQPVVDQIKSLGDGGLVLAMCASALVGLWLGYRWAKRVGDV